MCTRVTVVFVYVSVCVLVCVPKSDKLTWKSTLFMLDIDRLHIVHKQLLLSQGLNTKLC